MAEIKQNNGEDNEEEDKETLINDIRRRMSVVEDIVDDMNRQQTLLPWDRFRQWVYCIAIVTFDIELGQTIQVCHHSVGRIANKIVYLLLQHIYPASVKLTEREVFPNQ